MKDILKKYDLSKNFFLFDIFLFLYISSLISHKLGYGFDALYCRLTFVFFVGVSCVKIFLDYMNKRFDRIIDAHLIWLIVFWWYCLISILWSLDDAIIIEDFNWNTTIQILIISMMLFYRIRTMDDFVRVSWIVVFSVVYMCILVLLRMPISELGTKRMGDVIGVYSNSFGRYISFAILLILYNILIKEKKNKKKIILLFILIAALFALLLLSGSRAALLLCLLGSIGLLLLLNKNKTKYLIIFIIFIFAILLIRWLVVNPSMYKLIGYRIEGLFSFFEDKENVDASTTERMYFIQVAKQLFYEHPILGAGFHNFKYYIGSIGYSHVTYSHSNHFEVLSCLGVVGYFLYYSLHMSVIIKSLYNWRKLNKMNKFSFLIVFIIFFLDIMVISYFDVFNQIILALCFFGSRYKNKSFIMKKRGLLYL